MRLDTFQSFVAQIETPRPRNTAELTATVSAFFADDAMPNSEKAAAVAWLGAFADAVRKAQAPAAKNEDEEPIP